MSVLFFACSKEADLTPPPNQLRMRIDGKLEVYEDFIAGGVTDSSKNRHILVASRNNSTEEVFLFFPCNLGIHTGTLNEVSLTLINNVSDTHPSNYSSNKLLKRGVSLANPSVESHIDSVFKLKQDLKVTVLNIGSALSGTFSGTLYNSNLDSINIAEGSFFVSNK